MKWYHPLTALVLLSRMAIPTQPKWFENRASDRWAYSLAGLLIALPAVVITALLRNLGMPDEIAAIFLVALPMILTGALHEDGLSDCADGFWGGQAAQKRLEIMKDSNLGTYGTLTLVIITLASWVSYGALLKEETAWPAAVIAIHMFSRASILIPMTFLPHARSGGLAAHVGKSNTQDCLIAFAISTGFAIVWFAGNAISMALIAGLSGFGAQILAQRKIGGQTGDVLGATQQVTALLLLIYLAA